MHSSSYRSRARSGYSLLSLLLLIAIVAVCLASIRLAILKPSGRTSDDVLAIVMICGVLSVVTAAVLSSVLGWRWYQIMGAVPVGILFGLAAGATATLPLDWPTLVVGPLALLAIAWNLSAPKAVTDVASASASSAAWDAEPLDAEVVE